MLARVVKVFLFSLILVTLHSKAAGNLRPALMPMPTEVQLGSETLKLPDAIGVTVGGFSAERRTFQLARMQLGLSRIASKPITLNTVDKASAFLHIDVAQAETDLRVPTLEQDESYQLIIDQEGIHIKATTVFGAQHGLTTLLQLTRNTPQNGLSIPHAIINDSPRFAWRGLLIDSARQFFSLDTLKRQLDGMAAAKLNVFHWHLTDDQGWRFESKAFAKLTEKASDGQFYRQSEIQELVEYATLLGIRVVPEIGMPGHASAIAVAYPELMAKSQHYEMERGFGVFKPLLDVSNPVVFSFIDTLLMEVTALFPDRYLHIGGDEVEPEHWLSNPQIQTMMREKGLKDGHDIQNEFNTQLLPLLTKHQRIMMGWDEIFHPKLPKSIVVQSWRGHDSLNAVAKADYQGVLSTGFYIDQPQYTDYHYRNDPIRQSAVVDLTQPIILAKQFKVERLKGSPIHGELVILGEQVLIKLNKNHHVLAERSAKQHKNHHVLNAQMDSWMGPLSFEFDFQGDSSAVMIGNSRYPLTLSHFDAPSPITLSGSINAQQATHILGAEATLWSEMITERNIDLRAWPRLFAIAERLWSVSTLTDSDDMYARLAEVDEFAHHVVGLQHREQQQAGFKRLLSASQSDEDLAADFALLNQLSLWLEPSHYYTRHHIKYRLGQYSTDMPLDNYVDFLAVESALVRSIDKRVARYQAEDEKQLEELDVLFVKWQQVFSGAPSRLNKHPKLRSLATATVKLQQFFVLSRQVIATCKGEKSAPDLSHTVLNLQALNDEIVIAGIYPIRRLSLSCQQ
jgi:hexosaminidase